MSCLTSRYVILPLASRELTSPIVEWGFQAHREGFEISAEANGFDGLYRRGHRQWSASSQHIPDRLSDEMPLLEHGADLRPEQVLLQQAGVRAVESEHAMLRFSEAQEQV